jgi:hypothetical protein
MKAPVTEAHRSRVLGCYGDVGMTARWLRFLKTGEGDEVLANMAQLLADGEAERHELAAQLAHIQALREGDETLPPGVMRISKFESISDEWKLEIEGLKAERDALATEVTAWRALAEWESEPGKFRSVVFEHRLSAAERYLLDSLDDDETPRNVAADSVQEAAMCLATKLRLLSAPPGGKETT